MVYSRAWGKLIREKLNSKISWHCPFKTHPQYETKECAGNVLHCSMLLSICSKSVVRKIRKEVYLFAETETMHPIPNEIILFKQKLHLPHTEKKN